MWYPAEVNTSIRPGWFHHPAEDHAVRSAEELYEIYRRSVGGNSTFLLNVPPDRSGRITAPDVATLAALGEMIAERPQRDRASAARVDADGRAIPLPSDETVWNAVEGDCLRLSWDALTTIEEIVLGEDIAHGQQLDDVVIRVRGGDEEEREIARVGSIGYRRIVDVPRQDVTSVAVLLRGARGPVRLRQLAVLGPSRRASAIDAGHGIEHDGAPSP